MYVLGARSASNLGRLGIRRGARPILRTRRLRGLAGGSSTGYVPGLTPVQAMAAGTDQSGTGPIPGSSLYDLLYNAATGNVSQDQADAIAAQNAAAIVQASGGTISPAQATAQATSDVADTLDTFNGPGAFGIDWTGAAPDSSTWASGLVPSLPSLPGFSIPSWVWWIGGGAIGMLLLRGWFK
jgi:hypothetical protein